MLIDNAAVTDTGELEILADGLGGSGTIQGGDGSGGYAYLTFSQPQAASAGAMLDVTGDLVLDASGIGGIGLDNPNGTGGNGGAGFGGSAEFFATSSLGAGDSITVNAGSITLGANGDGGYGGNGITGGNGGEGSGGEALAELYSGTITAAYVSANAAGAGGNGGNGGTGPDGIGGVGGDGSGGICRSRYWIDRQRRRAFLCLGLRRTGGTAPSPATAALPRAARPISTLFRAVS